MNQTNEERNYHIFYCILAGMSKEERNRLYLYNDASGYAYLNHGDEVCEGRDDKLQYSEIRSAMKVLMFQESETWEIHKILAALLHLGNIKYSAKVVQNLDTTELANHKPLEYAADLLEVDPNQLRHALTTRTIFAYGDTVVSTMSTLQAQDVKDAFVKGVYGRLFVFIVDTINHAIYNHNMQYNKKQSSIGVLGRFTLRSVSLSLLHSKSPTHLANSFISPTQTSSVSRTSRRTRSSNC